MRLGGKFLSNHIKIKYLLTKNIYYSKHCTRIKPDYYEAAELLVEHDPPLYIAMVDGTTELELATRYEIGGFPLFKFFK